MSEDSKDCWQCRLISGGGLIGASAYVILNGKKLHGFSRYGVTTLGYGLGLAGTLRLLGVPPFKIQKSYQKSIVKKNEEDEYIVGKFP